MRKQWSRGTAPIPRAEAPLSQVNRLLGRALQLVSSRTNNVEELADNSRWNTAVVKVRKAIEVLEGIGSDDGSRIQQVIVLVLEGREVLQIVQRELDWTGAVRELWHRVRKACDAGKAAQ